LLGKSKSGKTCLLNALLGYELAHHQTDIDTFGITFFRSTSNPNAIPLLYEADEFGQQTGDVLAKGVGEIREKIGTLHKTIRDNPHNDYRLGKRLLVITPMKFTENVKDQTILDRFQVVDVPGPDAITETDYLDELTWDITGKAHLVLFAVESEGITTASNEKVLRRLYIERDDLKNNVNNDSVSNPLFVVATKIDKVIIPEKVRQTMDDVYALACKSLKETPTSGDSNFPKSRIRETAAMYDLFISTALNHAKYKEGDLSDDHLSQLLKEAFGVRSVGKTSKDLGHEDVQLAVTELWGKKSSMNPFRNELCEILATHALPMIAQSWHDTIISEIQNIKERVEKTENICKSVATMLNEHLGPVNKPNSIDDLLQDVLARLQQHEEALASSTIELTGGDDLSVLVLLTQYYSKRTEKTGNCVADLIFPREMLKAANDGFKACNKLRRRLEALQQML
jgi:hypothetical protein